MMSVAHLNYYLLFGILVIFFLIVRTVQIPKNIDQLSIDRSLKHAKSPRDNHVIDSISNSVSVEPRRIKQRRQSPRLQHLKVPTDESLQEPKRDEESTQARDDESLSDLKRDDESTQTRAAANWA